MMEFSAANTPAATICSTRLMRCVSFTPDSLMDLVGEVLDALGHLLRHLRELCVLFQEFEYLRCLFFRNLLPFDAGLSQCFAVLRVGVGMRFLAIGLARLREEDQR